jgi:hypothetical protein
MNPRPRKPRIIIAHVEGSGTGDIGVNETVSVSTDMFPEAPKAEKSDEPPSLDVTL